VKEEEKEEKKTLFNPLSSERARANEIREKPHWLFLSAFNRRRKKKELLRKEWEREGGIRQLCTSSNQ
jgi:hypothetical protein